MGKTFTNEIIPKFKNMKQETKIITAAIRWWRGNRPKSWSERLHIGEPEVNCRNDSEKKLAQSVAKYLKYLT